MASITQYRDGWRAFLYVRGHRETRTFRTKREAQYWADRREEELGKDGGAGSKITFGDAAERWLAWKLPRLTNDDNVRTVEQSIREHVLPDLGARRLSDIKRRELVAVVQKLAEAGKVETAHRVGQRIRAIFDHAVDHGDIEQHPAAGLSRVLPAANPQHIKAIRSEELPELLRAINGYPEPVTRAGLLLLAHTFVRTSELLGGRWAEIRDETTWVIPEERMKLRIPHVVPLSNQVRSILKSLHAMTGEESPFFLPSPANPRCPICNNTLLFALYRLGYRGKMTGHGFRSVASTVLNERKEFSHDAIERQLAHRETDRVREAYHRAEYLDERRRMLQWWSDYLDSAMASSTQR